MKILIIITSLFLFAGCSCDDDGSPNRPDASAPDASSPDASASECPRFGQVAVAEECNGFDDDCDGVVDEDVCDDPCVGL